MHSTQTVPLKIIGDICCSTDKNDVIFLFLDLSVEFYAVNSIILFDVLAH